MKYDRRVIAYHGCPEAVARDVLAGASLRPSQSEFQWLGPGCYFWEYGPERALEWAKGGKGGHPPEPAPAVVGAIIQLGRCLDLLDTEKTRSLAGWARELTTRLSEQGLEVPSNRAAGPKGEAHPDGAVRTFDNLLIGSYCQAAHDRGEPLQTVRAAFVEGDRVAPGSGVMTETHIQVCVRDPDAIVGYFRPNRSIAG